MTGCLSLQDPQIPEDLRKDIQGILDKKKSSKNKFYPGSAHGFTIRGDPKDPKQQEDAADAFAEAVSWIKTHTA